MQDFNAPVVELDEAAALAERWRAAGESVVFTNGHFDLLHAGHVFYLQTARAQGDRLVVAMNSDASTRLRKGPQRPIVPQAERAELLAALRCVDAVIIFESEDCRELVQAVQPQVYAKGSDWNRPDGPRPPEAAVVESYGGRVVYLDLVPGFSTTSIITTILTRFTETQTTGERS
ncbi:MAG: adenylyltransferase/cytidyltransferase family protein [Caldilineales bacterium]|nr:adenylyltransferase/cytidyltransferase family protein [Caldilineales bacterium]